MKRRLIALLFAFGFVLLQPVCVLAADDEAPTVYDARLEGFYNGQLLTGTGGLSLKSSGTALVWISMLVMTGLCVGVMFKDAGRTHLD